LSVRGRDDLTWFSLKSKYTQHIYDVTVRCTEQPHHDKVYATTVSFTDKYHKHKAFSLMKCIDEWAADDFDPGFDVNRSTSEF